MILIAALCSSAAATALWLPGRADGQNDRTSPTAGTLPRPIVDTHQLMELFNKPLYSYLKESMQQQPTDDKGWKTIQERGFQAAEVMNLVAIRERESDERAAWDRHVRTAQQAGLQLADAAKARDWQQTRSAYEGLIRNCNQCHQKIAPDHAPQVQP